MCQKVSEFNMTKQILEGHWKNEYLINKINHKSNYFFIQQQAVISLCSPQVLA